jgi:hypothetical protein
MTDDIITTIHIIGHLVLYVIGLVIYGIGNATRVRQVGGVVPTWPDTRPIYLATSYPLKFFPQVRGADDLLPTSW